MGGRKIEKVEDTGVRTGIRKNGGKNSEVVNRKVFKVVVTTTNEVLVNLESLKDRKSAIETELAEVNELIAQIEPLEDNKA